MRRALECRDPRRESGRLRRRDSRIAHAAGFCSSRHVERDDGAPTRATLVPTRSVPTRTPITMTSAITLTLWTTEDLAPGTTPAGRVLKNQFDAFSRGESQHSH